jgi:hypothetical protein
MLSLLTACGSSLHSDSGAAGRGDATASAGLSGPRRAPPADLSGRWVLASPNAGYCNVTIRGGAGASEGDMAPEGGCPGDFFTSRKWTYEGDRLVIRNHRDEPLAQLALSGPGRLEGRATNGAAVSLSR